MPLEIAGRRVPPGAWIRVDLVDNPTRRQNVALTGYIKDNRMDDDLRGDALDGVEVILPKGGEAGLQLRPKSFEAFAFSGSLVWPSWVYGRHDEARWRLIEAMEKTGADIVVPLSNQGPFSLLLAGEKSDHPAHRVRPCHAQDVIDALADIEPRYPAAAPPCGDVFLLSERVAADVLGLMSAGKTLAEAWDAMGLKAVIADNVYAWNERSRDPGRPIQGGRWEATVDVRDAWLAQSGMYRRTVDRHRVDRLNVQLLAVDLGTWGGSYCTLRLASELRHWGINAQVGRLVPVECRERLPIGTVHHHHEKTLPDKFCEASGWSRGILVATHWSTGRLVKQICEANDGITPVAFWQDLEDRFRDPLKPQKRFPEDQARDYKSIPNRVYNAEWQIEEGLDADAEIGHQEFIPVGVDTRRFHPGARDLSSLNRRPRVLAMWRPQTPRRGASRIRETYALLKRWAPEISLETFGWSDGLPADIVSHGYLSQRRLGDLLREVDVFIEASEWQGFGLPGLEAMASGAALVSTDTKGVWAYADRECAAITEPKDGEHLAFDLATEALRVLGLSPGELKQMRQRALLRARELDWGNVGARWARYLFRLWLDTGGDPELVGENMQVAEAWLAAAAL